MFVLPVVSTSSRAKLRRAGATLRLGATLGIIGLMGIGIVITASDLMKVEKTWAPLPPISPAEAKAARPLLEARWAVVYDRLTVRLHQKNPIELGAVWATRSGKICGLVNGFGSFGGLTAMTRFYTEGQDPVFNQDELPGFQEAWLDCDRDRWLVLRQGTDETGFCGTKLGQQRCYTVKIWKSR